VVGWGFAGEIIYSNLFNKFWEVIGKTDYTFYKNWWGEDWFDSDVDVTFWIRLIRNRWSRFCWSGGFCESISHRLHVKNVLLCFIFSKFCTEEAEERFFLLGFFFNWAKDQFIYEELSMITSWLSTEWLVLTEVETLLRWAGCSLVRSLDLVTAKFVFLFLDVDCGIIIAIKSRSLLPQRRVIRQHTSCCRFSECVGKRLWDY